MYSRVVSLENPQAVRRQSFIAGALVQSQTSPSGICGGPSGNDTSIFPSTKASPCQYHSVRLYTHFIHETPNLKNPVNIQHVYIKEKKLIMVNSIRFVETKWWVDSQFDINEYS
jgi:hypothetical protein